MPARASRLPLMTSSSFRAAPAALEERGYLAEPWTFFEAFAPRRAPLQIAASDWIREDLCEYSIDLTVDWGNERVRIEVDGPGHFLPNSRSPLGSTLLKRRQLQRFGHKLLSLPYWELEMLDHPNALTRRQLQCEYLSYKLDELTGMRLAARGDGWVVIDTALMDRRPELFEESDEVAADAEGTQSGARDEDDEDDDDDDDDDDDGMGAEADAVAEDTGGQAVRRRPERYLRHQALNDEALDALLQEVLTANGITPNWIPSSTGPPRADLDEPTAIVDAE
eukprot:3058980-Pleurochrysis_carterae.AAC.1